MRPSRNASSRAEPAPPPKPELRFRRLDRGDYERMRLPEAYWRAELARVPAAAQRTIRKYILGIRSYVSRPVGLILSGPAGVGKTAAAGILLQAARALQPLGYSALFVTPSTLRESIKHGTFFSQEEGTRWIDRAREVDVLLLDDLRAEDAKDPYNFTPRLLEELVLHRAGRKRATYITTRLDAGELDSAFPSLMRATEGILYVVPVEGTSQRTARADAVRSGLGIVATRSATQAEVDELARVHGNYVPKKGDPVF